MSDTIDALRRTLPLEAKGSWYEIKNQADGPAVVRIYDEIGFWGVSAAEFAKELDAVTATEIEVQISSPGGDVFDGIAIYNALRAHPAKVTTRVDGLAASAASVIVQAGENRVMLSASQMMIHEAWGLTVGSAEEMRKYADVLDRQSDVLAGIYAERSGKDAAEFRAMMTEDTWLTDEQAVEAGLADEVVSTPQDSVRVPKSLFVAKAMATLPEDKIPAVEPPLPIEEVPVEETNDNTVPQSDYDAVVAERDALRTELEGLNPEAKDDTIDVLSLPEPVQAALREAEAIKARVAKMEADNRQREFTVKAGEFTHVAGAAELGPVLDEIDANVKPETMAALTQYLKAANARIAEGGLYAEIGTSGGDTDASSEAAALVNAKVAEGLSRSDAIRAVFTEHPELYPAAQNA